ncbi:MAG: hypothetical protein AMXMBFR84_38590 [Candidatus Hydrogenedentota bacterium]
MVPIRAAAHTIAACLLFIALIVFPVSSHAEGTELFKAGSPPGTAEIRTTEHVIEETADGITYLSMEPQTDPYEPRELDFYIAAPVPFHGRILTVEISFLDRGAGVISVSARSGDRTLKQTHQASYTRLNTGTSRSAWFAFQLPPKGNPGDAVTLSIQGVQYLQSIHAHAPLDPATWDSIRAAIPKDVTPLVTLQRPMELVTSAGVDVRGGTNTLEDSLNNLADLAPLARLLGFTAVESYVTWKRLEPEVEGQFDFAFYDAIVNKLAEYDLKWFPLLIVGSAYALPDWFIGGAEDVGFVCLEHGIENPIQSIWSPYHQRHVTRVLQAFGAHYEPMGVLQGVRLGPSGNYGESQYPAGGNWSPEGQEMHIHIGMWAADAYAIQDFRAAMRAKYTTVDSLNTAWETRYTTFDEVPVMVPQFIRVPRQRLDTAQWYTDSMSEWCAWWVNESAKALPHTPIYQSAGGWGFLEGGTDYVAQTAAMVPVGGGIRLTNETDSFEQNFYVTRLAATAARLLGTGLGYEPASSHTARGTVGRVFHTATTNGDHFFTYFHNIMNQPMSIDKWIEYANVLDLRQDPVVEVAVYYPETMNRLDDGTFRHLYAGGFYPRAREVRRVVDVDYLDETLIRDGYLERYKVLVFCWGNYIESDVLAAIDAWVQKGGVVVYPSFPRGDLQTIEGKTKVFAAWTAGKTGQGSFHRFPGDMEPPSLYGDYLRKVLRRTSVLNPLTSLVIQYEMPEHVFVVVQADGHALALNYSETDQELDLGGTKTAIPSYGIARVPLTAVP